MLLITIKADIAGVVVVGLLVVNGPITAAVVGDLILIAEIKRENSLVVQLEEHWEGTVITDFLTQWRQRSGKVEELGLGDAIVGGDEVIMQGLQSRIHVEGDHNLVGKSE